MPRTGYFYLKAEKITVSAFQPESVTPYLLGRVLGLWLEMHGVPLLHGACLKMNDGAIGLLGQSGMGKSTLSAAMLQTGFELLSDDLILLERMSNRWIMEPGIQQLRIWPDSGKTFFDDYEDHGRVHPDYEKRKIQTKVSDSLLMAKDSAYLKALVVLERHNAETIREIQWQSLQGAEAMMALIANSYNVEALEALGWQQKRLQKLASLCEDVPVWALKYPSGYGNLSPIVQTIAGRWG